MGVSLYTAAVQLHTQPINSLVTSFLVLLCVCSILTGFRLWQGRKGGKRWATILFALQIPVFTVPDFSYEYYTALSVKVMGGHVDKPVNVTFGYTGILQLFDPRVTDLVYGVNLFGLAATAYLVARRRNFSARA